MEFQKVFRDYNVNPEDIGYINIGWKYVFPNGYGASVIDSGYGSDQGLFEVAVLKKVTDNDYKLCYDTPITDDVIGWLTNEQVIELLEQIKELRKG